MIKVLLCGATGQQGVAHASGLVAQYTPSHWEQALSNWNRDHRILDLASYPPAESPYFQDDSRESVGFDPGRLESPRNP